MVGDAWKPFKQGQEGREEEKERVTGLEIGEQPIGALLDSSQRAFLCLAAA